MVSRFGRSFLVAIILAAFGLSAAGGEDDGNEKGTAETTDHGMSSGSMSR